MGWASPKKEVLWALCTSAVSHCSPLLALLAASEKTRESSPVLLPSQCTAIDQGADGHGAHGAHRTEDARPAPSTQDGPEAKKGVVKKRWMVEVGHV